MNSQCSQYRLKPLVASLMTVFLTACGGGGGSSSAPSKSTHVQMSGAVVDGYLANAMVCLDLNLNGYCDPLEPSTQTDSQGQYTLPISAEDRSNANFNKAPVLVVGGYDIDTGKRYFGKLVAEQTGQTQQIETSTQIIQSQQVNISAISTLVSKATESGKTYDEAKLDVQKALGLTSPEDTEKDPVKAAKDNPDDTDAKKLLAQNIALHRAIDVLVEAAKKDANLEQKDTDTVSEQVFKALAKAAEKQAKESGTEKTAVKLVEKLKSDTEVSPLLGSKKVKQAVDVAKVVAEKTVEVVENAKDSTDIEKASLQAAEAAITVVEKIDAGDINLDNVDVISVETTVNSAVETVKTVSQQQKAVNFLISHDIGLTDAEQAALLAIDMASLTEFSLANIRNFLQVLNSTDTSVISVLDKLNSALENHAPVMTSPSDVQISVAENSSVVASLVASDADSDAVSYLIQGGDDAGLFVLNTTSGELKFKQAPDYENPQDANKDNIYQVTVAATDGLNLSSPLNLQITVTNVDESEAAQGAAFDWYISGATAFADFNGNMLQDSGEPSAETDSQGHYQIVVPDGSPYIGKPYKIVIKGGADTATDNNFTGVLKTSKTSTTASMVTTLVESLKEAGKTASEAEASVRQLLGVSAGTDLYADPAQSNELYQASVAVNAVLTGLTETLSLATTSNGDATALKQTNFSQALQALTTQISESSTPTLDSTLLEGAIEKMVNNLPLSDDAKADYQTELKKASAGIVESVQTAQSEADTFDPNSSNPLQTAKSIQEGLIADVANKLQLAGISVSPIVIVPPSEQDPTRYSTLFAVNALSTDSDCAAGGQLIKSGFDSNLNGVLDASEVSTTYKICNGANGSNAIDPNAIIAVDLTPKEDGTHLILTFGSGQELDAGVVNVNGNTVSQQPNYAKGKTLISGLKVWIQGVEKFNTAVQAESEHLNQLMKVYDKGGELALQSLSTTLAALVNAYNQYPEGFSDVDIATFMDGNDDILPPNNFVSISGQVSYDTTNHKMLVSDSITVVLKDKLGESYSQPVQISEILMPVSRTGQSFNFQLSDVRVASGQVNLQIPTAQVTMISSQSYSLSDNKTYDGDLTLALSLGDTDSPVKFETLPALNTDEVPTVFTGQLEVSADSQQIQLGGNPDLHSSFNKVNSLSFNGKLDYENKSAEVGLTFNLDNAESYRLPTSIIDQLNTVKASGEISDYVTVSSQNRSNDFSPTVQDGQVTSVIEYVFTVKPPISLKALPSMEVARYLVYGVHTDNNGQPDHFRWLKSFDSYPDLSNYSSDETTMQAVAESIAQDLGFYPQELGSLVYQKWVSIGQGAGDVYMAGEVNLDLSDLSNLFPQPGTTKTQSLILKEFDLGNVQQAETIEFVPLYTADALLTIKGLKDDQGETLSDFGIHLTAKRNGIMPNSGGLELSFDYLGQKFTAEYSHQNIFTQDVNGAPLARSFDFMNDEGAKIHFNNVETLNAYSNNPEPTRADIIVDGLKVGYVVKETWTGDWLVSYGDGTEDRLYQAH